MIKIITQFRDELNIIISDVNKCNKEKINSQMKIKEKYFNDNKEYDDDDDEIKLNLNYNDDTIEKNIPKEQEERINLIKKYNRPETSYAQQKNIAKK